MALDGVCTLAIAALVILTAVTFSGCASDVGHDSSDDMSLPARTNITMSTNHVSPKAYSLAQTIVSALSQSMSLGTISEAAARGKMNNFMQIMVNPFFLIPQLIMLGFAPIALANLKMLVMKALMMNNMALSAALWMTIKSLVFGPSPGPQVKYVNYGYKNTHPPHPPRDRSMRS